MAARRVPPSIAPFASVSRWLVGAVVAVAVTGCLDLAPAGGESEPASKPFPVELALKIENHGSKELTAWVNVTGPSNVVLLAERVVLDPAFRTNWSVSLEPPGSYSAGVDWYAEGEKMALLGLEVSRDEFRTGNRAGWNTTRCEPGASMALTFIGKYYNAGIPPLNPVLSHGLRSHVVLDSCG